MKVGNADAVPTIQEPMKTAGETETAEDGPGSRALKLFIRLKLFPVSFEGGQPVYRRLSANTLAFVIIYPLTLLLLPSMLSMLIMVSQNDMAIPGPSYKTDTVTNLASIVLYSSISLLPLSVAKGIPKLWPLIAQKAETHQMTDSAPGLLSASPISKFVQQILLLAFAHVLILSHIFRSAAPPHATSSPPMYMFMIFLSVVVSLAVLFYLFVCNYFVTVWLRKLTRLCLAWKESSKWAPAGPAPEVADLVRHFRSCSEGLGSFYQLKFSLAHLGIIAFLYRSLTLLVQNYEGSSVDMLLHVVGYLLYTLSCVWEICITADVAEECLAAVRTLSEPLADVRRKLLARDDVLGAHDVEQLVGRVNGLGPFSARGFFLVQKQTITSIIGSTVTYLIVLIQFKIAEHQS